MYKRERKERPLKSLRQKWNSSRGASIFLAMLLLLLCVVAGASVVMAAASNAGKIRDSKEEQQKYLTLSSAVSLLCDELSSVRYAGNFSVLYENCLCGEVSGGDIHPDGHIVYEQKDGALTVNGHPWALDETSGSDEVLPLHIYLDSIFAERFREGKLNTDSGCYETPMEGILYKYRPNYEHISTEDSLYILTLTAAETVPKDAGGITSDGFQKQVTASVRIYENRIVLNASIDGSPMKVRATMYAVENKWPRDITLPVVSTEDLLASVGPIDKATEDFTQWELDIIEKVTAEPETEEGGTP